jgi:hypothetical protein
MVEDIKILSEEEGWVEDIKRMETVNWTRAWLKLRLSKGILRWLFSMV